MWKKIKKAVISFSLVKVLQLLLPLMLIPIITSRFGLAGYGEIVFAQAIMTYALVFVNFGADAIAVKRLADGDESSKVIVTMYAFKIFVLCVILLLFIFIIPLYDEQIDLLLICLSSWVCFYDILHPTWYFQYKNKYYSLVISNVLGKVFILCSVWFFTKFFNQLYIIPLCALVSTLLTGIYLSKLVVEEVDLKKVPSVIYITEFVKESSYVFLSKLSQLYLVFHKVIVCSICSSEFLAIYDLVEKCLNVLRIPVTIYLQSAYATFAQERDKNIIERSLIIMLLFNSLLLILVTFSSRFIGPYFFNGFDYNWTYITIAMCSSILPITVNSLLGVGFFIPLGLGRLFMISQFLAAGVYIFYMFFLHFINKGLTEKNLIWGGAVGEFSAAIILLFIYIYRDKLEIIKFKAG